MADQKPLMPVAEMISTICGDGSSDYMDGDNPGYGIATWDPDAGELVLTYESDEELPDDLCPFASTVRRFREVL